MAYKMGETRMLQQEYVLGAIIERLNGHFIGKELFPAVPVESDIFKWAYKNVVGGMTGEVDENDIGDMVDTEYEQRGGNTTFYRERTPLSEYARNAVSMVDLAQDKINTLAQRAALRIESLRINAIIGARQVAAGNHLQYWTDLSVGGRNWIGGGGAVSILDDIVDGHTRIAFYARMNTDILICGSEIAGAMQKNIEAKNWDRKGPMALEYAKEGTQHGIQQPTTEREAANIGRIAGHEVFVSNAVVLSNPKDKDSALVPLLRNDVYLIASGLQLGFMATYEPIQLLTKDYDAFARMNEWQIGYSCGPVIWRPQGIYTIANARV